MIRKPFELDLCSVATRIHRLQLLQIYQYADLFHFHVHLNSLDRSRSRELLVLVSQDFLVSVSVLWYSGLINKPGKQQSRMPSSDRSMHVIMTVICWLFFYKHQSNHSTHATYFKIQLGLLTVDGACIARSQSAIELINI